MSTSASTLYFQRSFRTIKSFSYIFVRIIVDIWITVRISPHGMIVDVHLRIPCVESVVSTGFVIQSHVFCRTEILREFLCNIVAGVGISFDLKTVDRAAFGGDKNCALSSFCSIQYDGLSPLEERYLLNFGRKHVVGRSFYSINNDERQVAVVVIIKTFVVHPPKIIAVPSSYKSIHVFKTAHRKIFIL